MTVIVWLIRNALRWEALLISSEQNTSAKQIGNYVMGVSLVLVNVSSAPYSTRLLFPKSISILPGVLDAACAGQYAQTGLLPLFQGKKSLRLQTFG